jgi:hypothetical protein
MALRADMTPWTTEEVAYLAERSAMRVSARQLVTELNHKFHGGQAVRSYASVTNAKQKYGATIKVSRPDPVDMTQYPTPPELPAPTPIDPIEAERERRERLAMMREEREALTAIAGERSLRKTLEDLVTRVARPFPPPPPYRAPVVKPSKKVTTETMVQMWSDWHAGEAVSSEAMRGFNEYSDAIFHERVDTIVESHLSIKNRLEAGGGYRFERCVIAANGDFVSGTIHELEKHSDHENVIWAVYDCGMVLAKAIRELAAVYPTIEVFCTSGNHGRLPDARRIQQKEPTRSWDTLCYLFARENLRNVPNVTFYIPNSYAVAFDIYGWRWLQTHGHDVKSWNSIPWYGLNRLIGNMNALEAGRGLPVHYWAFGHFHNASSLPHASGESFVNGSLIGSNEFALNALGKVDRPTQWLLQVHPEHGVTGRWPLFAGSPVSKPRR